MNLFTTADYAARRSFVAVVACSSLFTATSDKVETFCMTPRPAVAEVREVGWSDVVSDASRWTQLGAEHPAHDADEVLPTSAALATARSARFSTCDLLVRPDVWGSTGDGGFYIEQHDGSRVVMLWIEPDGSARLSVFVDGVRQGQARTI